MKWVCERKEAMGGAVVRCAYSMIRAVSESYRDVDTIVNRNKQTRKYETWMAEDYINLGHFLRQIECLGCEWQVTSSFGRRVKSVDQV